MYSFTAVESQVQNQRALPPGVVLFLASPSFWWLLAVLSSWLHHSGCLHGHIAFSSL